MKHPILFLAAAATLWLASGCQTSGPYAPQAEKPPGLNEATATVVLMDLQVQASITSSGDRSSPMPDGRLKAQVSLKNRESRRVQVQVQCVFKDDQGFAVDETPWMTYTLTENATEAVEVTSMNTLARKYTFRVRQMH
ncbi:MAG: YcfL family protein [Verrucomicrobiota bacterium]